MAATIPGYYSRESEFQRAEDPITRAIRELTGACGSNALAQAIARARQAYLSTVSVYQAMRVHGLCDANGISNINALQTAARLLALPVTGFYGYQGDSWPQWQAWLDDHLSHGPVVLEVAHGQELRDAITGLGENAVGLRYHFIAVLAKDSAGRYIVADGDNLMAGNVLQTYAAATLSAAAPCAALAIAQVAKIAAPAPAPWVQGSDGWWTQTATGKRVGDGLYKALCAKGWQGLPVRANERFYGGQTYSAVAVGAGLNCHVIVWDHSRSVPLLGYDAEVAADLLAA